MLRARAQRLGQVLPELDADSRRRLVEAIHQDLVASQAGVVERAEELIAARLGLSLATRAPAVRAALAAGRAPGRLYSGARRLLETIKGRGWRCVIVSNAALTPAAEYLRHLDDLGLGQLVDGLVSSFDVGYRKPHPAMFAAALELAACPAQACLMIGDDELRDIQPAAALGMRTVRVCIQSTPCGETRADLLARSLPEVTAWLSVEAPL